jgi:hypothetical protein
MLSRVNLALILLVAGALFLLHGAGWFLVARRHLAGRSRWLAWLPVYGPLRLGRAGGPSRARNAAAVLAGAFAGYVAVALAGTVMVLAFGVPRPSHYRVHATDPGFSAHGVLQPGDTILAIGGTPIWFRSGGVLPIGDHGPSMPEIVNQSRGAPLAISYERAGAPLEATLAASFDVESRRYRLGLTFGNDRPTYETPGLGRAAIAAAVAPARFVADSVRAYWSIQSGEAKAVWHGADATLALIAGSTLELAALIALWLASWLLAFALIADLIVLAILGVRALNERDG